MPYISPAARGRLENGGLIIPRLTDEPVGSLTYIIYLAMVMYMDTHSNSYQTRAEVLAAAESAKLEFYRRECANYEEAKLLENGDV